MLEIHSAYSAEMAKKNTLPQEFRSQAAQFQTSTLHPEDAAGKATF